MKWYKKIGLLATTGLALFGLGACSNDGKSADGTVTIEYFNQKKEMTKTLEEIARDFEKENPKVKVKVVNVPNAGEVLKTRVLAGDVPDVVNIYPQSIELQEWAKAGVFEDLSNKDYMKRVKNGYAEKYAVNGKVYNVPFTANAYGIYYNKDKFEELGLKVPETWVSKRHRCQRTNSIWDCRSRCLDPQWLQSISLCDSNRWRKRSQSIPSLFSTKCH